MYAVTYVEKIVTIDHYETGCETTSRCVMSERIKDLTADSLSDLMGSIADRFGFDVGDMSYLFLSDDGDSVPGFSFNRTENVDGFAPTDRESERFRTGEITLYLADYYFSVERREVFPVLRSEFATLPGITVE